MKHIAKLRLLLREKDCPFFSDEELQSYYEINGGDIDATLYHCFTVKAENTTLNITGLSCEDTSKYFLRLAQRYRKTNSRNL